MFKKPMPGDLGSRGLILLETVITVIHCCHKGINIVRSNIDVYAKFWLYPLNVAPEIHSSDQATVFFPIFWSFWCANCSISSVVSWLELYPESHLLQGWTCIQKCFCAYLGCNESLFEQSGHSLTSHLLRTGYFLFQIILGTRYRCLCWKIT